MGARRLSSHIDDPAILTFASRVAPTHRPDIRYAMISPSMTVAKMFLVQIAAALISG